MVFAVSDEGHVSNSTLKSKIKEFGSKYIDEVGFRYSWAMIGKKGLAAGEAVEQYSPASSGSVTIDTTFISPYSSGSFITNTIGESLSFDSLIIDYLAGVNNSIQIIPIINKRDTLDNIFVPGVQTYSLNSFNNGKPNSMKFIVQLNRGAGTSNVFINKFGTEYKNLPELTSSGRLTYISKNKIIQGDSITLNYGFINAGESIADSVELNVYINYPDNSKKLLDSQMLINVGKDSSYKNNVTFLDNYTNGFGDFAFEVKLDETNKVPELFEDNNIFIIPFEIQKDTVTNLEAANVDVLFNGQAIFDNETVNNHPTIKIVLSYQPLFDYSDTTQYSIYLDGRKKYFSSFDSLEYDTINREIKYTFKPLLSSGEHSITITGRNIFGNIKGESGYQLSFKVTEGLEIVDLYNYPNPMKEDTYFIFGLPELPDNLILKVFTIAGREIYSKELDSSELNFNLNKIYWDGRDNDGDTIANGVYFYKFIIRKDGKSKSTIGKLAVLR
ncbi:MAG: hypothetical protein D6830_06470 [Ignavibacteria bacterium]|nr:MAG: hypothetical protein D6830_06470 [Ignavibacteria bacterium]